MRYFIFGLQRSGTNFIEQSLTQNFGAQKQNRTNACWKHFIDPPQGWNPEIPTILIHKNPYTWVESICFRNTVDWIKTQRKYPAQEAIQPELQLGPQKINLANLAKTYHHFHNEWLWKMPPEKKRNMLVIKYEDLLIEEKKIEIFESMKTRFGAKQTKPTWTFPARGRVSQSSTYSAQIENYYINMQPQQLNDNHIRVITNQIGPVNIRKLGYNIL